jgi:hypothetical protein
MKTPREVILESHRAAAPQLDAIRREIVDAKFRRRSFAATLWQELFLPSRRIWTSLATIWILILAVNFAERDPAPAGKVHAVPMMMSLMEQQRRLDERFADSSPAVDADREKTFSPKPRTEIFQSQTA